MKEWLRDHPLFVERLRVQDKPEAGDTGGGSDKEFNVAAAAVAEADAEKSPYVPPLPVPFARPIHRDYTYNRGLRSAVWLVRPVTTQTSTIGQFGALIGGGVANAGEDFPINSIMIDNVTVAWAYWPAVGVWVPPFNIGRVFRFDGSHTKQVWWENPPALATPVSPSAAQSLQTARVTFYEELLEESSGLTVIAVDR